MRKSMILALLLAVLALFAFCGAGAAVNGTRNAVEVTETILLGEKEAAQGIQIQNKTQSEYQLFWDTRFTAGNDGKSETSFQFYPKRKGQSGNHQPTMDLFAATNFSSSGDAMEQYPERHGGVALAPAMDVASRTQPGETREEEVLMRDYYDSFPMAVRLDNGMEVSWDETEELTKAFESYLKVPIPEKYKMRVKVEKGQDGSSYSVQCSDVFGGIMPSAEAVYTKDGWFFAVTAYDWGTGDAAALPDGVAGLHQLPLKEDPDGKMTPDPSGLRRILPLDGDAQRPLQLLAGLDGDGLLLFAIEDREITLSVVKGETVVQTLPLAKAGDDLVTGLGIAEIIECDEFLTVIFTDGRFCVLTQGETGYKVSLKGDFYKENAVDQKDISFREMVMDFDGERLAAVFYPVPYESCGVYLMVFNEAGLEYAAKYDFSSDQRIPESRYMVRPQDENCLSVSFTTGGIL